MWKIEDGLCFEENLKKFGVSAFTTTTFFGNMKDEKNRKFFLEKHFRSNAIILGEQVHGNNIEIVTGSDSDKVLPQTDGLITQEKGIVLGVFIADCLPIFIFDRVKKIIGLIHAGRAGLSEFIVFKTIDIFVKNFDSNLLDIYVSIGPHICKECYNVNLDAIVEEQLKKISVSNISNSNLCTYTGDFFSYRKTKTKERMLSVMTMST